MVNQLLMIQNRKGTGGAYQSRHVVFIANKMQNKIV